MMIDKAKRQKVAKVAVNSKVITFLYFLFFRTISKHTYQKSWLEQS